MVSIKDVARHAGVAISTVSKVLNHYPNVSDEMRKKVIKSVEELGFVPNSVAAALSSKQSGRVALLINWNTREKSMNEAEMQYLAGAINEAMDLGLDIITLFTSMFEERTPEEVIRYLKAQSIQGIILYGMLQTDRILKALIQSEEFKIVIMDLPIHNQNISCVLIDQAMAQYDVAKKTILDNQGKSVLYIAGKKDHYITIERLKGIKKLAEELQLKLLIKYGEFSELSARNLTQKFAPKKDVIVCASDLMAIGAMRALMEMDIFRPVCGFDGLLLMGYAGKQMYTVKQDFKALSASALKEMHYLISGGFGRVRMSDYNIVRMKYEDVIT